MFLFKDSKTNIFLSPFFKWKVLCSPSSSNSYLEYFKASDILQLSHLTPRYSFVSGFKDLPGTVQDSFPN